MGSKPSGVMVYYDDFRTARKVLSDEQLGKILRAVLEFAELGLLPDFEGDPLLQLVWGPLESKIVRDFQSYEKRVQKSRWGVRKREAEKRGETFPDFDSWLEGQQEVPMMGASSLVMNAQATVDVNESVSVTETVAVDEKVEVEGNGSLRETGPLSPTAFERKRRENVASLLGYK